MRGSIGVATTQSEETRNPMFASGLSSTRHTAWTRFTYHLDTLQRCAVVHPWLIDILTA